MYFPRQTFGGDTNFAKNKSTKMELLNIKSASQVIEDLIHLPFLRFYSTLLSRGYNISREDAQSRFERVRRGYKNTGCYFGGKTTSYYKSEADVLNTPEYSYDQLSLNERLFFEMFFEEKPLEKISPIVTKQELKIYNKIVYGKEK